MNQALDHLPAGKRRELEFLVGVIREGFTEAIAHRTQPRFRTGKLLKIILFGAVALSSCATRADDDPLRGLLSRSQDLNGQEVQAAGIFSGGRGVANIYSPDRRECIGLLTHNVPPAEMASLEGRKVRASGRLMAEGCPKGGSCDEHLCGPAILYNARVERQP